MPKWVYKCRRSRRYILWGLVTISSKTTCWWELVGI